jgi:hypothetical protein
MAYVVSPRRQPWKSSSDEVGRGFKKAPPGRSLLEEFIGGVRGRSLTGEELVGEELIRKENVGKELIGKENIGKDLIGEELAGEEFVGEELVGEELAREELVGASGRSSSGRQGGAYRGAKDKLIGAPRRSSGRSSCERGRRKEEERKLDPRDPLPANQKASLKMPRMCVCLETS